MNENEKSKVRLCLVLYQALTGHRCLSLAIHQSKLYTKIATI